MQQREHGGFARGVVGLAVWAVVAGMGLGACAFEEPSVPPDGVRLASHLVLARQEAYSGFDEPARLVIRDAGTWAQRWAQIAGPGSALPAVDFDQDMVVVAAMGQRNHGGYDISIEGVFESADGVYVDVLETSPGASCGTTQALVAPVVVVAVPRRDAPVIWVERSRTRFC